MTPEVSNWLALASKRFKNCIDASRDGAAAQIIFDATQGKVQTFPALIGDDWVPNIADQVGLTDFVWLGQPRDYIDTRAALAVWNRKALYLIAGLGYDDPEVKRAADDVFGSRVEQGHGSVWFVRFPEKKRIRIATPGYGGSVAMRYCYSLCQQIQFLSLHGIDWELAGMEFESLVPRARTGLFADFLSDPVSTHLMFIDADISWKPEELAKLLYADKDVIAGVYRKKTEKVEWPCNWLVEDGVVCQDIHTGAIEMYTATTGFLMISKRAALRMVREYPERRMRVHDVGWHAPANANRYEFFPIAPDRAGLMPSEDFGFCQLWQAIGGTVWALPDIELTHHGAAAYTGKLSDSLEVVPA